MGKRRKEDSRSEGEIEEAAGAARHEGDVAVQVAGVVVGEEVRPGHHVLCDSEHLQPHRLDPSSVAGGSKLVSLKKNATKGI